MWLELRNMDKHTDVGLQMAKPETLQIPGIAQPLAVVLCFVQSVKWLPARGNISAQSVYNGGVPACNRLRRNLRTHLMNAACHQQVCRSAVSPMLVLNQAASQTEVLWGAWGDVTECLASF